MGVQRVLKMYFSKLQLFGKGLLKPTVCIHYFQGNGKKNIDSEWLSFKGKRQWAPHATLSEDTAEF